MTTKMTISDALSELGTIVKKLESNNAEVRKFSSKRKGQEDLIEKQRDYVKGLIQSSRDLLTRYVDLKIAVQRSNTETYIQYKERSFRVAEALILKQGLFKLESDAIVAPSRWRGESEVQTYLRELGTRQVTEDLINKLDIGVVVFYDELRQKQDAERLVELKQSIDRLIDKSNHNTFIEI